jgi:uncharacterized membrane protein (UPF0127 family)
VAGRGTAAAVPDGGRFPSTAIGHGVQVDRGELWVRGVRVTSVEIAVRPAERRRGLLGRDDIEGALLLPRARQVHTVGMRFPLDVIWCDRAGIVLRTATLVPNRISPIVWRSATVVEAAAGAVAAWEVRPGDRLAVR